MGQIENEHQLKVTISRLKEFQEASIVLLETKVVDQLAFELQFGAISSQIRSFQDEIMEFKCPKQKIHVYSREDCAFKYCDSSNSECEKNGRCHYNPI